MSKHTCTSSNTHTHTHTKLIKPSLPYIAHSIPQTQPLDSQPQPCVVLREGAHTFLTSLLASSTFFVSSVFISSAWKRNGEREQTRMSLFLFLALDHAKKKKKKKKQKTVATRTKTQGPEKSKSGFFLPPPYSLRPVVLRLNRLVPLPAEAHLQGVHQYFQAGPSPEISS